MIPLYRRLPMKKLWDKIQKQIRESEEKVTRLISHPDFDPTDPEFLEIRVAIRKRITLAHTIEQKLRQKRIIGYHP